MLRLEAVDAGYGKLQVLWGVTVEVGPGVVVALLGPNGAGKTTLVKTIMGLCRLQRGRIWWKGQQIGGWAPHRVAAAGIGLVPQGKGIFPSLTVRENLEIGAGKRLTRGEAEKLLETFPRLRELQSRKAWQLSGGEQQMLAVARALAKDPELVLMDEPSEGLAPAVLGGLTRVVRRLAGEGKGVLLVEQNVRFALHVADYVYVMREGRIIREGSPQELGGEERLRTDYLGAGEPRRELGVLEGGMGL
jgi:ABC-type branched-subunit amino acid transport system ATPase component